MKAEERVHHCVGTYSDLRLGSQQAAIPHAVESLIERNKIFRAVQSFHQARTKPNFPHAFENPRKKKPEDERLAESFDSLFDA